MKKLIALMLAIAFVFTLSACNDKNTASNTDTNSSASNEIFVKPKNYTSVLLVSINPQFKLYLDKNNDVLAVEPVNEDAKSFSKNIDFENKSIETVIGNIIEQANENGFIKENVTVNFEIAEQKDGINNGNILSKAVSAANKKATELKIEIKAEIKESDNSQTAETNRENTQTNESSKPTTTTKPTESSNPTHTHKFSSETCTAPKTCSCGATEGQAIGHNYKDGKCSRCGAEDHDYIDYDKVYTHDWGFLKSINSTPNSNMHFYYIQFLENNSCSIMYRYAEDFSALSSNEQKLWKENNPGFLYRVENTEIFLPSSGEEETLFLCNYEKNNETIKIYSDFTEELILEFKIIDKSTLRVIKSDISDITVNNEFVISSQGLS